MSDQCAACLVAERQAKSTHMPATCSACGAEFIPPLPVRWVPQQTEGILKDMSLWVVREREQERQREYPIVPPEQCPKCKDPPADTVEGLLHALAPAARWLSLASPRATSLEPRAPGSTGSTSSPVESAVHLAHGRHTLERARAIAAREGGSVAAALWWILERAPQLVLSPDSLPEQIARALGTPAQHAQWWPAPPPKPSVSAALGIPREVAEDIERRYRRAKEGGFMGGQIWGRDLVATVLEAWRAGP